MTQCDAIADVGQRQREAQIVLQRFQRIKPFRSIGVSTVMLAEIAVATVISAFHELDAMCARDNGRMWGMSLCGPTVFVEPQTRHFVARRDDKIREGAWPASMPIANTSVDWDGDRCADIGVYSAAGTWSILLSTGGYATSLSKSWGGAGYVPATAEDFEFTYPKGAFKSRQSIARLGHRIKGEGGGFGFGALSRIGNSLETAGKQHDRDSVRTSLEALRGYLDEVRVVFRD